MVNMKELFAFDRISDQECELAPLTERELASSLLATGDLLFARQSLSYEGAGKCVLVLPATGPRTWESHLIRVRLDSDLASAAYFYYFFRSPRGRRLIETIIQQVAAAGIRGSDLGRLEVPCPALSDQQAIAEVLGALDDKIAAGKKESRLIDEFITARFRAAFAGRDIQTIPLFEAMTIDFGEAFKGASFSTPGEGRALIRIRDLKSFSPQIWTTESRLREVTVMSGDILVGMDAEFRATTWLAQPGLLNQRVCRVRGIGLGNAFVREALRAPLAAMENQKSATTVIHLNKSDLERMEIAVPDAASLESFEDDVEHLYLLRVRLELENRTLAATRDALLPQLMSGKLRVKDAEKSLAGVL